MWTKSTMMMMIRCIDLQKWNDVYRKNDSTESCQLQSSLSMIVRCYLRSSIFLFFN